MQFQSEEETNAAPRESKLESSASQSTNMLTALRSPNRSATSPPDASQESQLPNPHRSRHLSKSSSNVQGQQQHQQDPTIAWWAPAASAGGLAAPASPTVVCAMDNGSTKLRIPVKFVHRTHAVNLLMAAADAGSPLPVRGPSSAAATAPSDTLENSVSVNVLPQPIPTTNHEDSLLPASQGLVLGSAVRLRSSTRSADDGEGGNNVSNNVNEGSWQRSPSSGPQREPQSFRQTDGREEDFSWSSADPAASAVAAAAAGTSQLQSLIHILREGLSLPTPPAICRLFQESKCRQGPRCHQIHVTRSTLDTFRNDARSRGNCCWEHDAANPGGRESEDPTWRWKLAIIHDALPRLKTISVLINSGTSVGGGGASGEGGTAVTPPTALSLPTLGPNQTSQGGPSVHYDPARAMERSGPNLVTSTGPESSLELSLTSTPFLSQHGAAPLSSPKYMYASGASYSGEFVGSGDDRSQRASLGEPLGIFSTEKVQIVTTRSQLHANQISPTLGLLSAVLEVLDACAKNPAHQIPGGLELPFSSLCRLHLRGPVCKFGDLCRYIHICRHSHISMAAIRSPATSGPERPLPSDGQLTTTSDRIHRTPQGSGHLISSVVATIGASSGSRTTVTTSSGGTAETNRTKNRSSSSDEEQQLSHVLLPCPTPPPPNVQVKIWQNMPYHFRRKKPSKSGGQPSQKTSSERPEKK